MIANERIKNLKAKIAIVVMATMAIVGLDVRAYATEAVFTLSADTVYLDLGQKKDLAVESTVGVGRIDISSSDDSVVTLSDDKIFLDRDSAIVELEGKKVGTAVITFEAVDFAVFETEEEQNGISRTVTVVVEEGDNPSGGSNKSGGDYNNGKMDDDRGVTIPNTSVGGDTPNTGQGQQNNDNLDFAVGVLPVIVAVVAVLVYMRRVNKRHRKFE